MKRILLIDPPGPVGSLNAGLAYLAGSIKGTGNKVSVLDLNNDKINLDVRLERALAEGFDIVGLSIKSNTLAPSIKIAEKCKQMGKGVLVVAGGPEVTVEGPRFLEENRIFDFAFLGEAEEGISEFLNFLEKKASIESVKGLCYRKDGNVLTNPTFAPTELDALPFPDYSVFDTFGKQNLPYPLVTSRGCPYNCTYCCVKVVSGKRFRARSASNVADELEQAKKNFGVNDFVVIDDTFTQKMERAKDICKELINRRLDLTWHCFNGIRADKLDEELLGLMKHAGCKDIWFGVESLDPEIFAMIKKGETTDDILMAIKMTKENGINVSCFFIIGLPKSTYKKDLATLKKAKKLGIASTHWGLAIPIPGTELWNWVNENAIILRDYRTVSSFIEPEPVFETKDYTAKKRLKMFYKANLAFFGYRDLVREINPLGMLKIVKIIILYDPIRLPLHLLIGLKRFFERIQSPSFW